ncbi:MAG: hypothetical protein ACI4SF_09290, partial [Oscillospiraceae bacterium]
KGQQTDEKEQESLFHLRILQQQFPTASILQNGGRHHEPAGKMKAHSAGKRVLDEKARLRKVLAQKHRRKTSKNVRCVKRLLTVKCEFFENYLIFKKFFINWVYDYDIAKQKGSSRLCRK